MGIIQAILICCLPLLAVLIYRIPELGLMLCVVFSLFLKVIVQPLLGPIDITIYLFTVTYGAIFIRSSMEKRITAPNFRINLVVILLVSFLLASLLQTPLPKKGIESLLYFVFVTISVMYATFMWCTNINRIRKLLFIFSVSSLAYGAIVFIWVFLLGHGPGYERALLFSQMAAIKIAQLLAAAILAAVVLRSLIHKKHKRLMLNLLLIVAGLELIALNSRAPIIGLFVAGAFLFLLYKRGEKRRFALVCLVLLAAFICAFAMLPQQYTGRYLRMFSLGTDSIVERFDMWRFAVQHFFDWFFIGAGMSGFGYYHSYADPHNIFLDIFAHAGFFALLAFAWLIGLLIYKGIIISRTRDQSFHILGLAIVVPFIALLVSALFSTSIGESRALWFFGGLILSLDRLGRDRRDPGKELINERE